MYLFFHNALIPELIKDIRENTGDNLDTKQVFKLYVLTCLCVGTIYKWMVLFGFKYLAAMKTYYVDGHEKMETIVHQKQYVSQYVKNKVQCFRWVQLTIEEIEKIEKEDPTFERNNGYKYQDNQNQLTMYEYHVDQLNNSHKINNQLFGESLSVRKKDEDKPIIMMGQDKCIYKQYLQVKKQWYLLSSFVSQDFGCNFDLFP